MAHLEGSVPHNRTAAPLAEARRQMICQLGGGETSNITSNHPRATLLATPAARDRMTWLRWPLDRFGVAPEHARVIIAARSRYQAIATMMRPRRVRGGLS